MKIILWNHRDLVLIGFVAVPAEVTVIREYNIPLFSMAFLGVRGKESEPENSSYNEIMTSEETARWKISGIGREGKKLLENQVFRLQNRGCTT